MRGLLIPLLAVLISGAATGLIVIWLRRLLDRRATTSLATVLAAHGRARVLAATRYLDALSAGGRGHVIADHWDQLEPALLGCLADAAPGDKVALIAALTQANQAVANRGVAKALMDMRDSLIR